MKVLILGSGGREHALAWAVKRSERVTEVVCAPGNGGMAQIARCIPADLKDLDSMIAVAEAEQPGLTIVGPEVPLSLGIVDALRERGLRVFGPTREAAMLETSKGFAKRFLQRHNIPTANYAVCTSPAELEKAIDIFHAPIVVKADGLAAGKGVVIAPDRPTAEAAIDDAFGGGFGAAGARVVIEEFLEGEIGSLFALCDGKTSMLFGWAQDHKRAFDGDEGPNTGGMGTYSPAPVFTYDLVEQTRTRLVEPAFKGIAADGAPYRGVLFVELMSTRGGPKLIEFNARFGDPECQVLMLRMMSDIVPAMLASCDGQLKNFSLRWFDDAALTVIMATRGYPGDYGKGFVIEGLDDAAKIEGVEIFHAGTKASGGKILSNGGRVLNVCALGKTVSEAQQRAYAAVDKIKWPEGFCRRDIGWQAVEREREPPTS